MCDGCLVEVRGKSTKMVLKTSLKTNSNKKKFSLKKCNKKRNNKSPTKEVLEGCFELCRLEALWHRAKAPTPVAEGSVVWMEWYKGEVKLNSGVQE